MTMYDSQDDHDDCKTIQILTMIKIILINREKTKKYRETKTGDLAQHLQARFLLCKTCLYWGLMEYWTVISDPDENNDPPFIE